MVLGVVQIGSGGGVVRNGQGDLWRTGPGACSAEVGHQ